MYRGTELRLYNFWEKLNLLNWYCPCLVAGIWKREVLECVEKFRNHLASRCLQSAILRCDITCIKITLQEKRSLLHENVQTCQQKSSLLMNRRRAVFRKRQHIALAYLSKFTLLGSSLIYLCWECTVYALHETHNDWNAMATMQCIRYAISEARVLKGKQRLEIQTTSETSACVSCNGTNAAQVSIRLPKSNIQNINSRQFYSILKVITMYHPFQYHWKRPIYGDLATPSLKIQFLAHYLVLLQGCDIKNRPPSNCKHNH